MKHFLFFVFGLLSLNIFSQDWCHQGSVWRYQTYDLSSAGSAKFIYNNDTIIAGEICHIITMVEIKALDPQAHYFDTESVISLHTLSRNDTVFFYHSPTQQFVPVYFFNAQVGDTITYPSYAFDTYNQLGCGCPVKQVVDSAGIITINNQSLRYYGARNIPPAHATWYWDPPSVKIVERIGPLGLFMIPYFARVDSHYIFDGKNYDLLCYEDDSFPQYQVNPNLPCYYLSNVSDIEQATFSLHPNPANDAVILSLGDVPLQQIVVVYNLEGKELFRIPVSTTTATLSLAGLSPGIYLVKVLESSVYTHSIKLVKY